MNYQRHSAPNVSCLPSMLVRLTTNGSSIRTEEEIPRTKNFLHGRKKVRNAARGKFYLRAWTTMEQKMVSQMIRCRNFINCCISLSLPQAAPETWDISLIRFCWERQMLHSLQASFILVKYQSRT